MTHTFSKPAFYSFGDIPLAGPLPLILSHLQGVEGGFQNSNRFEFDFSSLISLPNENEH
jgi:hypothetical protein